MSERAVREFIEGLETLEATRDANVISQVFAENCNVGNVISHERFKGRDGAYSFWTKYRDMFADVKSTFRNVIVADDRAALEWTTEGTSLDGDPVSYNGVTILEMEADAITRCRAYFDAESLGRQMAAGRRRRTATYI